jgi:glycosyltransferase family protein
MNKIKLLIFGAGQNGRKVSESFITANTDIVAYIDNDKDKNGSAFLNKPIITPSKIFEYEFEFIVISNYIYQQINDELVKEGIDQEKIINYYQYSKNEKGLKDIFNLEKMKIDILEYEITKLKLITNNIHYEIADKINKEEIQIPIVKSCEETIEEIIKNRKSISRFGDGELPLAFGLGPIGFQKSDKELAKRLREILVSKDDILIGIMDAFGNIERYSFDYQMHLRNILTKQCNRDNMYSMLDFNKVYYNTFISRPYTLTYDSHYAWRIFELLKGIWNNQNIVFIEGSESRLGYGNDLFDNAKSIRRIVGPKEDAFDCYDSIYQETLKVEKDALILLALGPTATILAYDLAKAGYWAVDIGHVDIEYEWYLMGVTRKVPIKYKYVNEARNGDIVDSISDDTYRKQIIAEIKI